MSPLTVATISVTIGMGLLSLGFSAAPGWREFRWFAFICFTAAMYSIGDSGTQAAPDSVWVKWGAQFALAGACAHCAAWIGFMREERHRPISRLQRWSAIVSAGGAVLSLLPNVTYSDIVVTHEVPWLGARFVDVLPTITGQVVYVSLLLVMLQPLLFYWRAWRLGDGRALTFAASLTILCVAGFIDALSSSGVFATPYCLPVAFLLLVLLVGSSLIARFVASARQLEVLLSRSEKLAAVGRMATGVAHEVNNPAAAVIANLSFLQQSLPLMPEEGPECIADSLRAMDRIKHIVHQLLASGRAAGGNQPVTPVPLLPLVKHVMSIMRSAKGDLPAMSVDVDERIVVMAQSAPLEQVLSNLIGNAALACAARGSTGHIQIAAARLGDKVQIDVIDNGTGMSTSTQERLFEPFFTTRPQGEGTGLGLAVSAGIVGAWDGQLSLLQTSPHGTTMRVVLQSERLV